MLRIDRAIPGRVYPPYVVVERGWIHVHPLIVGKSIPGLQRGLTPHVGRPWPGRRGEGATNDGEVVEELDGLSAYQLVVARHMQQQEQRHKHWRLVGPMGYCVSSDTIQHVDNLKMGGILRGDARVGKSRVVVALPGHTLVVAATRESVGQWEREAEVLGASSNRRITVVTRAKLRADVGGRRGVFLQCFDRMVMDDASLAVGKTVYAAKEIFCAARWCVGSEIDTNTAACLTPFGKVTDVTVTLPADMLAPVYFRYHPIHVPPEASKPRERDGHPVQQQQEQQAQQSQPEQQSEEECCICMGAMGTPARMGGCAHAPSTCLTCMRKWTLTARTCPVCRSGGPLCYGGGREFVQIRRQKLAIVAMTTYGRVFIWSRQADFADSMEAWGMRRTEAGPEGVRQLVVWDHMAPHKDVMRVVGDLRRSIGPTRSLCVHMFRKSTRGRVVMPPVQLVSEFSLLPYSS